MIPEGCAHLLLAFEPAEAVRNLRYLSSQGTLIVCDSAIKPVGAAQGAVRSATVGAAADTAQSAAQGAAVDTAHGAAHGAAQSAARGAATGAAQGAVRGGQVYEAETMTDYLKANVPGAIIISGKELKEQCGKTLNVALIGVAAQSGAFPFDAEALIETIEEMPQYREQNITSLELGRKIYSEFVGAN